MKIVAMIANFIALKGAVRLSKTRINSVKAQKPAARPLRRTVERVNKRSLLPPPPPPPPPLLLLGGPSAEADRTVTGFNECYCYFFKRLKEKIG